MSRSTPDLGEKYITIENEVTIAVGENNMTCNVDCEVDLDTIIDRIRCDHDDETALAFIMELDGMVSDVEFSMRLLLRLGDSLAEDAGAKKEELMGLLNRFKALVEEAVEADVKTVLSERRSTPLKADDFVTDPPKKKMDGVLTPVF